MVKGDDQQTRISTQWPISITLILCAIFASTITLKAKSDINAYRNRVGVELSSASQNIANNIDKSFLVAKANLGNSNIISNEASTILGGKLVTMSQVQDVAIFDAAGQVTANSTATGQSLNALSAAASVANDNGWFGTIALGQNVFKPAMAVKNNNGEIIAATLKIPSDFDLKPDFYGVIADKNNHIIYASEGLKIANIGNLAQAFNLSENADPTTLSSVTTINGEKYFISNKSSESNFIAYGLLSESKYKSFFIKTIIFYALLLTGPILAFIGVWFLSKDRENRFAREQSRTREAERKLRIAIDGARCGIWDWDLREDSVYLSARVADTFGFEAAGRYSTDELMFSLSSEDRLRLRSAINAAAQIGSIDIVLKIAQTPRQINIKNGKKTAHKKTAPPVEQYVHFRGRAAYNKEDDNNLRIIGVSIDVSEQLTNEHKVSAAERRLRDAIASISGPFALWGSDGNLLLWNSMFAQCFKLGPQTLIIGAKYSDISKAAASAVVSSATDKNDNRSQELQFTDGKWVRMIERKTSEGGMVTIGVDITNKKRNEQSLLESESQLRKAVEELEISKQETLKLAKRYEEEKIRAEDASSAKASFLANMSHELRTPLNAINGFSQLMIDELYGPLGDTRYNDYAQNILASGKHLLELINDVLDIAKIEADKFRILPQNISLSELIDQSVRMLEFRAEEKNIIIETDLDNYDEIIADQRAVKQIIINLLSNSVKFTNKGGRILVRTRETGDHVTISVIDTGIGIPEDVIPRLGKAFEQVDTDHSRASQGTGLGLALCKSFTELHGGKLIISSKQGVGTKVDIILPKSSDAMQDAA